MGVRELKIWDIYHFVVLLTTWIGRNKKLHYSYSSRGCRISPPFNFFFLLYKINKGGIYAKQQHAKGTKNLNKLYTGLGSAPTYGVSERSLEVANTAKRRADVGADSYESRRVTPSASTQFRASSSAAALLWAPPRDSTLSSWRRSSWDVPSKEIKRRKFWLIELFFEKLLPVNTRSFIMVCKMKHAMITLNCYVKNLMRSGKISQAVY